MFDHHLTPEEAKRLMGKDPEEGTNQEDVPGDVLEKFPDFTKQHNCCPRCGNNSAREQIQDNGPLRFRCKSCGGTELFSSWK